MTGGWGRTIAAGAACAAISIIPDKTADAQDASGLLVTGDIEFGVELEDRSGADSADTAVFTDIRLGILSETQTSRLSFNLGGRLQVEDNADGDNEDGLVDPFADLGYTVEGADSVLDFTASYTEADVDDSILIDLDGDLLGDTVISSEGKVKTTNAALDFRFAESAPVGGEIFLSWRDRDFEDTISDAVFDTELTTARVTANFRPRQTLEFSLFVEQEDYVADDVDQTDRTTMLYGIGIFYEIDPILRLDASVNYTEVETETVSGLTENDGVGFDFTLTRDMPNGTIALFGSQAVATEVTRTELGVSRDLELPGAELGFSVAVSASDEGDTVWLAGVDYSRDFRSGLLTAGLSQVAEANDDDEEVLRSTLSVDYLYELTPVSSLGVGLSVARTEDIGLGDVSEGTVAELTVSYSQELTEDWDWRLSYTGRHTDPEGGGSSTRNTYTGTIGRSFSIRP